MMDDAIAKLEGETVFGLLVNQKNPKSNRNRSGLRSLTFMPEGVPCPGL